MDWTGRRLRISLVSARISNLTPSASAVAMSAAEARTTRPLSPQCSFRHWLRSGVNVLGLSGMSEVDSETLR